MTIEERMKEENQARKEHRVTPVVEVRNDVRPRRVPLAAVVGEIDQE